MISSLTYAGQQEHERLLDEVSELMPVKTPYTISRQLSNMKRLWVLDQYLKGRTSTMSGPIMGPIYRQLVKDGFIEEARKATGPSSKKYEKHGLTRHEDDILGAFYRGQDLDPSVLVYPNTPPERGTDMKKAAEALQRKGLIDRITTESGIRYHLTPKGSKLRDIREAEESEGEGT